MEGDPAAIQFKKFTTVIAGMLDRGVTPEELAAANLIGTKMLDNIFAPGVLPTFLANPKWYLPRGLEDPVEVIGPGAKRRAREEAAEEAIESTTPHSPAGQEAEAGLVRGLTGTSPATGPEGEGLLGSQEINSIVEAMLKAMQAPRPPQIHAPRR